MKLHELIEAAAVKFDDSALAPEVVESLKSEITELAKDTEQSFTNALELIHTAYDNCDVERPTPAMREAWAEYEELLTLAVQMLAKYRPDGDWKLLSVSTDTPKPASAL